MDKSISSVQDNGGKVNAAFDETSLYLSASLLICALPSLLPASAVRPVPLYTPWRRILLGLLLLLMFTQCRRKREPVLFLFPTGFVGNAVVVYNQPQGQPQEYRAGSRVYRIPSDGVLYSQFGPNNGVGLPDAYWYTDARGRLRQALRYSGKALATDLPNDTVGCCQAPVTDSNTPRGHYLTLVVGPNRQLDSLYEQQSALLFRLTKEIQRTSALSSPKTP